MQFVSMDIPGCVLITRNVPLDERGYFSRLVDVDEFRANGIDAKFVQISASRNYKKGTLRGLHSQWGESAEDKLVACVQGKIFDVCIDMREQSPTYLQYCSAILSEENGASLYVPKGCAHGFLSLEDDSQLIYFMTSRHDPAAEKGYRWDDPAIAIQWPMMPKVISWKDRNWALLS